MNLGEIQDNVDDLGYQQLDAQSLSAINRVYRRVLGMRRWDFLEATTFPPCVTGTSALSMAAATDFKRVDVIEMSVPGVDRPAEFDYLPYNQWRDYTKATGNDQGQPRYWTESAGAINIHPPADGTYNFGVRYIKTSPVLVNSTDIPILPEAYHDVLVYGAAAELAARERDQMSVNFFTSLHTSRLQEMIAEHGVRQRQNARYVRRSRFWTSIRTHG